MTFTVKMWIQCRLDVLNNTDFFFCPVAVLTFGYVSCAKQLVLTSTGDNLRDPFYNPMR